MGSERLLSIGEVAEAAGLRPSALRYYEEVGLISADARLGGRRHFEPSVLRRLDMIAMCQEVGFTVREIAEFLSTGSRSRVRWRRLSERKLQELDTHIARAKAARRLLQEALACGCADPGSCEMVADAARRRRASR